MALLRKRSLTARNIGVRVAAGVALIFVIGAVCGVFGLVLDLLQGKGLPKWSFVTYIGAAFALGVVYLLAEAVWYPIGKVLIEPDRVTDPLWKRSLRLAFVLAIVGAVMAGGIYAGDRGWLPVRFAW
jgi:hypothetical protein